MELKKVVVNRNKETINMRLNCLSSNEFVRARRLTPREVLRFMGVEEKYIRRMLSPYEELAKNGYTIDEVTELLTVEDKKVNISDRCLYQRAGNAIVVDVLYYLFESLLVPPKERIK